MREFSEIFTKNKKCQFEGGKHPKFPPKKLFGSGKHDFLVQRMKALEQFFTLFLKSKDVTGDKELF